MRITESQLKTQIRNLNLKSGTPVDPYVKEGDKYKAQPGNFHLSMAYGGYCLHQNVEGGGIRDVFSCGHVSKRELFEKIHAYMGAMRDMDDKNAQLESLIRGYVKYMCEASKSFALDNKEIAESRLVSASEYAKRIFELTGMRL